MQTVLRTAVLATLGIQSAALGAVEAFDPATAATTIAPFVDGQTIAIVHVNASEFDVAPAFAWIGKLNPEIQSELDQGESVAKAALERFRKAGGREAFVVFSLTDALESSPFGVVPLADGADENAVATALAGLPLESHRKLHGALVFGGKATLDRLGSQRPVARPEIARAFEAAGDTAAQLIIVPTADTRRVIEELLPTLPAEIGGGPSKTLTRGALWAALSVNMTPQVSASLAIQSQDRDAADALRRQWSLVYTLLGQRAEIVAALPSFNQIAAKLVPNVKGDRLLLSIDERNQAAELLRAAVGPSFLAARAASHRSQSVNNLKQLATAMHVYHDVHNHFPAAATYGADGKPLLSWRVQLLPHVGEENLFREFHHDEPWDSEHNKALIGRMPAVIHSPNSKLKTPGRTSYLAPVA
ncbi:MAG TPA: DUF1559 domain-containing protein, partial [Pirellulales bacterium]|nr:DUF1559 domain-containing protein [Pirellulales bacterium]